MKYIFIFLPLFILSCKQNNISGDNQNKLSNIEIIKFDYNIIKKLNTASDSIYYDTSSHYQGSKAILYFQNEKNEMTKIFNDSLGNVIGMLNYRNDSLIKVGEYYSNGQIMGKLIYSKPGIIHGLIKYYYKDGRIRSIGKYNNGLKSGEWKNYNKSGQLISSEFYDISGKLIKTEKI